MSLSLKGKVVLITGASRGIGRACAIAFAKEGADLILTARTRQELDETAAVAKKNGTRVVIFTADITNRNQVKDLFKKGMNEFGRIDILINNAGTGITGRVSDLDSEKLEYIFKLNFFAPLWCIQEVLPIMQKQNEGQIINISSVAGKRGVPFSGGYCASKFALNGLTESLRVELRNTNIHILLVCPAGTDTPFHIQKLESTPNDYNPPSRGLIKPEKVAEKILQASLKKKREIVVGNIGKFIVFSNWLNAGLSDWLLAKAFSVR